MAPLQAYACSGGAAVHTEAVTLAQFDARDRPIQPPGRGKPRALVPGSSPASPAGRGGRGRPVRTAGRVGASFLRARKRNVGDPVMRWGDNDRCRECR